MEWVSSTTAGEHNITLNNKKSWRPYLQNIASYNQSDEAAPTNSPCRMDGVWTGIVSLLYELVPFLTVVVSYVLTIHIHLST